VRADRLEQLFVKRSGGGFDLLLVLESPAGARERVTVAVPATAAADELAAVAYLVRWMQLHGAGLAELVRVRRDSGHDLIDAPDLRRALLNGLAAAGGERDDGWD
jgi:hypothetical protein